MNDDDGHDQVDPGGLRRFRHDLVLGGHGILLGGVDRPLPSARGFRGDVDGTIGDDVVLQLLGLDDVVIGGKETLDDRIRSETITP